MIEYIKLDLTRKFRNISKMGDPLEKLNKIIPWESFRKLIEILIPCKNKSSRGGRPSYDLILMFKIIIIQTLYNFSDEQLEFQINDRLSFMRFLSLSLTDKVPDARTIWLFKENLSKNNGIEKLFSQFENILVNSGFFARSGQIIDASIIKAPIRRTGRKNDELIKKGEKPRNWFKWPKSKKQQTDMDARWTKKRKISSFGYKNHINIDKKHRFIRKWKVSNASLHDSLAFKEIYIHDKDLPAYADAAYRSKDIEKFIKNSRGKSKIQWKKPPNKKLTLYKKTLNQINSIARVVVEHVFAKQKTHMNLFIRSIGLKRAKFKTGLANLVYNFTRFEFLTRNI